jgi:hypothetical protein
LAIGVAFAWLYERLARINRSVATTLLIAIFGCVGWISNTTIEEEILNEPVLGGSSRIAFSSMQDMKRLHPALPQGSIIFVESDDQPDVWWSQLWGGLFKMQYGTENISALYAPLGDRLPIGHFNADKLLPVKFEKGHLIDNPAMIANKLRYSAVEESGLYKLQVSRTEIRIGESYELAVDNLHDVPVRIMYKINDGPIESFTAALDDRGRIRFYVSPYTRKGFYDFVCFTVVGRDECIEAHARIQVD